MGIVAHPASVTSNFVHILPALLQKGARVTALFGPEHGFGGEAQDMEPVSAPADGPMGIPLYSLYGSSEQSLSPSPDAIKDLEALVIDVMDVGARYYTFVWTAVLCLQVCARTGTQLIVLDRPNPLGGTAIEGAPQLDGFLSFVGLRKVPVRHGLTVGEIVQMVAEEDGTADALTVVPMKGWHRDMYYDDTGLPWIAPSPNMPTLNTAIVYPGGCLLEATWCSEARGTTLPFELFGAPGIDAEKLCAHLETQPLPGARFRPVSFKPMFQKHAGQICTGAQLHVIDRQRFRPFLTGVAIISALNTVAPHAFAWRTDPYEFVTDVPAMDLLCGNADIRLAIEQGIPAAEIAQSWKEAENRFLERKPHFHLY
ncbi:MAG: DUF1343 domain-containing protein [Deltaproteobacteria bacterium]|nr:DUF1343 domain-containing protein [Deltaproteobacteria bacterium]MBN2673951.1 DUF1343 domain-containing protein [Deltaproteobacteria bacterium]